MENGQAVPIPIQEIFLHFMSRIANFDELVNMGNRLLADFREALGFLGRPSLEKSALLERIMQTHGTKRFISYVEAGCMNTADNVKFVSQLQRCHIGLKDNINKGKIVLSELKCLLDVVIPIVQFTKKQHEDVNHNFIASNDYVTLSHLSSITNTLIYLLSRFCQHFLIIVIILLFLFIFYWEDPLPSSKPSKPEVVSYAAMMTFIYSMVKQDYTMQEMIVSSLSLKSSQGELDTYCLMWSLRPYVDDDIMHQAWSLIR